MKQHPGISGAPGTTPSAPPVPAPESDIDAAVFDQWLARLARKWSVVPADGKDRVSTARFAELDDAELLRVWTEIRDAEVAGERFAVRGWYHALYGPALAGARVLDLGSGLGLDGLSFAGLGARVTFADIVPANLELLRRLARLMGVEADFLPIENADSFALAAPGFDAVWCQGSMINAPLPVARFEAARILPLLAEGARWIELAYPRARWEAAGRPPAETWGESTDGPGTPWVEWYDLDKMRARLAPATFDVVLHFDFWQNDFNWFDLKLRPRREWAGHDGPAAHGGSGGPGEPTGQGGAS
ncbi:MAG: methyltransferase domain-containing protein [Desulfovibrionaceae bacterium]|jgi:SAM-dependent methyltransferase|nr:methyltransferase domain-containing protein [Desulfovibrionaceae bacterium]